ncbi:MAG: type 1 glutamine amidotransferase [Halobacteriales archaeon]
MMLVLENEVDLDYRYLVDEITRYLPEHEVHDFARDRRPPEVDHDEVTGVVVGGSTAGVHEAADQPWIEREAEYVRSLVADGVPVLGICFGHQLVNHALGGTVRPGDQRHANLVRVELDDDPLFSGVDDVVPVLHSDFVVEPGDEMRTIATTEYYDHFATRHESAPVWTVQYHPEFTPRVEHLGMGWTENHLSFEDSTATRTLANFHELALRQTTDSPPEDEVESEAQRGPA